MRTQPWELMRPEYIRQQMAPSSPLDDSGTMDYWAMPIMSHPSEAIYRDRHHQNRRLSPNLHRFAEE